jgi:hypothetical protein
MYLLHIRPDLTYSICYLSWFMESPKFEHLAAVKRVLQYIAGTPDYGLLYPRGSGGGLRILGYSDSDMAGDISNCKSMSGVVFFLGDGAASWSSQKQKVVALSSYSVARMVTRELLWLDVETPMIMMDN